MGGKRTDHQEMAKYLVSIGIWHGRRMTKGLDNIPKIGDIGSAAYRRLKEKQLNK